MASVDQLEVALCRNGASLVLQTLYWQNPTSFIAGEQVRAYLASSLKRHNAVAIIDKTLCELSFKGVDKAPHPIGAFYGRTISVGSVSKSHWGGFRLGWARAVHEYINKLQAHRRSNDLVNSIIAMRVPEKVLRSEPGICSERRDLLRARRDAAITRLSADFREWEIPRPGVA